MASLKKEIFRPQYHYKAIDFYHTSFLMPYAVDQPTRGAFYGVDCSTVHRPSFFAFKSKGYQLAVTGFSRWLGFWHECQ